MNDDDMLTTMRSSLTTVTESMTDVHLERPVSTIQARARGRRLRRALAAATTGGLALGVGVALAVGSGPVAGARSVHVNLDAWSVNTLSSGLVYLDVRRLQDPVFLRQTLAAAGVPAIVTFGEFCVGPSGEDTVDLQGILGKTAAGGVPSLTINPAGIPSGSELSIGIVTASKGGGQGLYASFGIVKVGAKLTCGQPSANPGSSGKKGSANPAGNGPAGNRKVGKGSAGTGPAGSGTIKQGSSS